MKSLLLASMTLAGLMTGCLFDGESKVAGGEDFPNTIAPLGKLMAGDISANAQWDQFQDISQPPNVMALSDSLSLPLAKLTLTMDAPSISTALAKAAHLPVNEKTWDYTVDQHGAESDLQMRFTIVAGVDGIFNTKADNRLTKYEALRTSEDEDTLEWTHLQDGDGDGVLFGKGDSDVVEMSRVSFSPPLQPQVERRSVTLTAKVYHRGDSTVLLSYSEKNLLKNGALKIFTAKGIRGDSLLKHGDSALVTVDLTPGPDDALQNSHGRYFVRLGVKPWKFSDNALLNFNIENRWRSGVIRHSRIEFNPAEPVLSGHLKIHGNFTVSAEGEDGSTASVTGILKGDTLQAEMSELRNGKRSRYRVVYDSHGEVKERFRQPD